MNRSYVINNIKHSMRMFLMRILPDYAAVNLSYFQIFGKLPNIKNPMTFNEKIAWRKLYQRDPRFSVFADKIAVKAEIEKLIGERYIIETLWVGDNPDNIPFDNLEPPYVIKVNHSSGGNIFVRTKQDIDTVKIVQSMRKQLCYSHGHVFREWGYLAIPHQVIVERLIVMSEVDVPEDYKFFVYHGRVHFIQVDYDRFKGHTRNLYDRDWGLIPARLTHPMTSKCVSKPSNLDHMINIAEKIGQLFDFVRVDLYSTPQGILFGEVTFYPGAGTEKFIPDYWDYKFGEPWKI